jgi:predicted nucleic acid-binding protein
MMLADTSVWVQHFRRGEPTFVSGELTCGNLKTRAAVLSGLHVLPAPKLASNTEVLQLIEQRRLWGRGLGWVDMHLLTSALLSHCGFWTLDKKLAEAAAKLGLQR